MFNINVSDKNVTIFICFIYKLIDQTISSNLLLIVIYAENCVCVKSFLYLAASSDSQKVSKD